MNNVHVTVRVEGLGVKGLEDDVEREREQHEQYDPENQFRFLLLAQLRHVLLMLLPKGPATKTRKLFILARLLFLIKVNGAVVPLTGFRYFWKKY